MPVTAQSIVGIASIAKIFVASAVMQLLEQGKIGLDVPVAQYLPYFRLDDDRYREMTIRQVLSHTSGMPDMDGSEYDELLEHPEMGEGAPERYVRGLSLFKMVAAPGERFLYSNVGYKTLGLVLERLTGRPWWETVMERVMEPIGMGAADVIMTNESRSSSPIGYRSPFDDRPWFPRHGWVPEQWYESATADGTICATAEELASYRVCC